MASARKNIIFVGLVHFIGGFGLALLLQYYLSGSAFLPVAVGWVMVAFTLLGHIYIMMR